jgi:hypothetical protein
MTSAAQPQPRRRPRGRYIATGIGVLALIVIVAISPNAGLAVAAIFVPVFVGLALMIAIISRDLAPWPWVVGIGFSIVPATYMAAVRVCDKVGGVCPTGDDLTSSKQAAFSLVLFAAALALLFVRRSVARDIAFALLVLLGEIWLLLKLRDVGEQAGQIVIGVLILGSLAYEVIIRVRSEPAAPTAT